MAKYAQKAVDALGARYSSNLPTQLRDVETQEGLASGALTNPVAVVKAFVPADNRSPLIQVFENAGRSLGHRERLTAVDCTVALTWISDPDLEAAETFLRRYLTAMLQVLTVDPTLGGTVGAAIWTEFDRTFPIIDEAPTRHTRAIGVDVHVQNA